MSSRNGKVIVSSSYTPHEFTVPAFLVLELEDLDAPSGVKTLVFRGKAAKRLSDLREGDLYDDTEDV